MGETVKPKIIEVWQKVKPYLLPDDIETAKKLESGEKDDTTNNQQKSLKLAIESALNRPELKELLNEAYNELENTGSNNIIIQNSPITQIKSGKGDNFIGSQTINKK
jgi:hypothetical protein